MSQIYANTYLNWCMRNFCMSGAEPRLKFGERNPLRRKCSKQSAGCITHVNRMLYIVICHGLLARNIETKGLQNFVLSKSEPISDAAICRAENTSGMKSPMLSRSFPQHTFTWHAITDIIQNHLCLVADCLQGSTRSRGALLQQRCHQGWEPLKLTKSLSKGLLHANLFEVKKGEKAVDTKTIEAVAQAFVPRGKKQGKHMETNNNYTAWVGVEDAIHCKDSSFMYSEHGWDVLSQCCEDSWFCRRETWCRLEVLRCSSFPSFPSLNWNQGKTDNVRSKEDCHKASWYLIGRCKREWKIDTVWQIVE